MRQVDVEVERARNQEQWGQKVFKQFNTRTYSCKGLNIAFEIMTPYAREAASHWSTTLESDVEDSLMRT